MKRSRLLALLLSCLLLLNCLSSQVLAYERKDHDKYMIEVFFKHFKEVDNDTGAKKELEVLESASYLVIDQFNRNGQKELDKLTEYGVENIPTSVDEISFNASGATHRSYTHRGWDYQYTLPTKELWPQRKLILTNTVNAVFNFRGDEKKADSFCAIIYYLHILGDHMDDSSYTVKNGLKMEIGGRTDKEDIIHELLKYIAILFEDQQHTHKYISLTAELEKYNGKFSKLVNSQGGINSDDKFREKQKLTEKLMALLAMYFPEMLKDEAFFADVFYK